jgi:fumarate reductase flavoprotein subunit
MRSNLLSAAVLFTTALLSTTVLGEPPAQWGADLQSTHGAKNKLTCKRCHGSADPRSLIAEESLAAVNAKCGDCHGTARELAAETTRKLRNKHVNPHASHLVEIDCVTCHKEHGPSRSFCLECHAFDMPMPGQGKPASK